MAQPKPDELSKMGRAALWYAERLSWRVFPLHTMAGAKCSCGHECGENAAKHPRTKNGFHDGTTDPSQIRAWWARWPDANIGIATGNGLAVLDIDPRHAGDETLVDLRRQHGALPDTPESITGSGGRHIYLRFPPGAEVRNSAQKLGPGVDVRGEGGYVVAPPSMHKSGRAYGWEASSHPKEVELALVPEAWLAAMTQRPARHLRALPGGKGELIPEGQRNEVLFKRAASMRAGGFDADSIEAALQVENETRCQPPLDPAEVKNIARSAGAYPPGLSPDYQKKRDEAEARKRGPSKSEKAEAGDPAADEALIFDRGDSVEIAERLLWEMELESGHPIVFDRGAFWQYDPPRGVFVEQRPEVMRRRVAGYAGRPKMTKDGPKGLALSDAAIKGAVSVAATMAARSEFFNGAARGITFSNAFVTVEGGEVKVKDLSYEHRSIHALDMPYEGPDSPTTRWTGMLREVFRRQVLNEAGDVVGLDADDTEACIQLLQEFAGAAIMGLAATYAVCLVLVGNGNDGKSRVLNVLRALFPKSAVCHIPPQQWGRSFVLAELADKRLNVVNELPERDILDSDRFKAVVAGDPVTVERKYQDPFSLETDCAHGFACNDLPATKDQSRGFWRRFAVLPCERQFQAEEEIKDIDKLVIAEELAGIAAWAIEGAARLQKKGAYTVPPSVAAAKAEWQRDSDQVRQWVEQCCIELKRGTPSSEESRVEDLYPAYKQWAQRTGHQPLQQNRLAQRLKGLGFEHRTKVARLYRVKLKAQPPTSDPARDFSWDDPARWDAEGRP